MSQHPFLNAYIKLAAQAASLPQPGVAPPSSPPPSLQQPPSVPTPTVANPQAAAPGAGNKNMAPMAAATPSVPSVGKTTIASIQNADDFVSAITGDGALNNEDMMTPYERDSLPTSWSNPTSIEGGDAEGRAAPYSAGPPSDVKIALLCKAAGIPTTPGGWVRNTIAKPIMGAAGKVVGGIGKALGVGSKGRGAGTVAGAAGKASKGPSMWDSAARVGDVTSVGSAAYETANPIATFDAAARQRMGM